MLSPLYLILVRFHDTNLKLPLALAVLKYFLGSSLTKAIKTLAALKALSFIRGASGSSQEVGALATVRVGTSGWFYDWPLYPPGLKPADRLRYYANEGGFDCVEINTTFYDLPRETTFTRWREQTGDGFKFCIKGSKYVTHHLFPRGKGIRGVRKAVENLTTRAACLGDKLGPFLWQLPPIKADPSRLENFLKILTSDGEYDHVVEFRDKSWFSPEVFDLAETYEVSLCSFWAPWFSTELLSGPVLYLRVHGEKELYGGSYSDDDLSELALRLEDSFSESGGYVFFNTTNGGAVENALTLRRLVNSEDVKVHFKCPGTLYSPNPCPFEGDVMVKDWMDWVACPRCGTIILRRTAGSSERQEADQPTQRWCRWCGKPTKHKSRAGLCYLCDTGPGHAYIKKRLAELLRE